MSSEARQIARLRRQIERSRKLIARMQLVETLSARHELGAVRGEWAWKIARYAGRKATQVARWERRKIVEAEAEITMLYAKVHGMPLVEA